MTKRITALDVLGEVRRAMRILRRVERYLVQQERAAKRSGEKRAAAYKVKHHRDGTSDYEFGEQG